MMDLEASRRLELWDELLQARTFDQAMCTHNPHWHEARGEEAVVVGGFSGLNSDDVFSPHFRGACAAAVMHGSSPDQVAANVFGTAGSTSDGHWRGDICPTPSNTFIGMFSGSLGTTVSYATGAAFHLKRNQPGAIAVCAFGDGTANSGIVYESLNMAAMLNLPIVFICQDNQYATSLPSATAIAGGDVAARARACGIPSVSVDGNDVEAVLKARDEAAVKARAGGGPAFIHALTYRLGGHYMSDPETYRTEEEVSAWEERDPIHAYREALISAGLLTREEADSRYLSMLDEMNAIVLSAKNSPETGSSQVSAYAESYWGAS